MQLSVQVELKTYRWHAIAQLKERTFKIFVWTLGPYIMHIFAIIACFITPAYLVFKITIICLTKLNSP